jgi:ribonuclease HII
MLLNYFLDNKIEAGIDEAGRGCYAGPVVAAAVILPKDFFHPLLNDSKKMTANSREILKEIIEENAISYSVAFVDNNIIDQINILQATYQAMHQCVDNLKINPELLLIDGNRFLKYKTTPHQCIIKGDGKYMSIAAASVLAKTYRDAYMKEINEVHPHYEWKRNKGYGTATHRAAIEQYGICEYHRKSFRIVPTQCIVPV